MKFNVFGNSQGQTYQALSKDEYLTDDESSHTWKHFATSRPCIFSLMGLLLLLSASLGYTAGRHASNTPEYDWLAPAGPITHTFKYVKAFAQEPTEKTEHLWEIMFPKGRGYIQNPSIAYNQPVGVAVFHQIHCLDQIRRGYYSARNDSRYDDHWVNPSHVQHCIDYLRQSLLCAADTNMEPIDPRLGGVTGWGFLRKCRDIERVKKWAEEWRAHNQNE